jgi:hypothetical protein
MLPSAIETTSAPRLRIFEAQYPARLCPCLRFNCHLAVTAATLGVRMVRYSFPVPLFHRRSHAGLSRRTPILRPGFPSVGTILRKIQQIHCPENAAVTSDICLSVTLLCEAARQEI